MGFFWSFSLFGSLGVLLSKSSIALSRSPRGCLVRPHSLRVCQLLASCSLSLSKSQGPRPASHGFLWVLLLSIAIQCYCLDLCECSCTDGSIPPSRSPKGCLVRPHSVRVCQLLASCSLFLSKSQGPRPASHGFPWVLLLSIAIQCYCLDLCECSCTDGSIPSSRSPRGCLIQPHSLKVCQLLASYSLLSPKSQGPRPSSHGFPLVLLRSDHCHFNCLEQCPWSCPRLSLAP